jgi:hypothetical protein
MFLAGLLVASRAGVATVVTAVQRDLHGVQRRRRGNGRVGGSDLQM